MKKENAQKIKEFQQQIKEGNFKINAEKIADKLLHTIGAEYIIKEKKDMH